MFVNVVNVDQVSSADPGIELVGCHLDAPTEGAHLLAGLIIEGWVVTRTSMATEIRVRSGELILRQVQVNRSRPDVTDVSKYARKTSPGFRLVISVFEIPTVFELEVEVTLDDGTVRPLGSVKGRRAQLARPSERLLKPLVVSGLARMGSTWLMHLLGSHPSIAVYRPLEHDARLMTYWPAVLKTLTAPDCVSGMVDPIETISDAWWLGVNFGAEPSPPVELAGWCTRDHLNAVADFCRDRIDSFYRTISSQAKSANYFAEKISKLEVDLAPLRALYPDLRQIFLVRDFRDMATSMIAFNAKRGFPAFGRERVKSDVDFIEFLSIHSREMLIQWEQVEGVAHLVRYEDLVADEEGTFERILQYLDIDPSRPPLAEILSAANQIVPMMDAHRTSINSMESIGRWRRDLSPAMQEHVQRAFADSLEGFGYTIP